MSSALVFILKAGAFARLERVAVRSGPLDSIAMTTKHNTPLADRTGEFVRFICRSGCRKGQLVRGTLKRSERFSVQPQQWPEPKEYAGHVAVCPHCGYEAIDVYNWIPA